MLNSNWSLHTFVHERDARETNVSTSTIAIDFYFYLFFNCVTVCGAAAQQSGNRNNTQNQRVFGDVNKWEWTGKGRKIIIIKKLSVCDLLHVKIKTNAHRFVQIAFWRHRRASYLARSEYIERATISFSAVTFHFANAFDWRQSRLKRLLDACSDGEKKTIQFTRGKVFRLEKRSWSIVKKKYKFNKNKMEANSESYLKNPALFSTKSIDEGFESDPDREHSTDSEGNLFASVVSVVSIGSTPGRFDHHNRWQSHDYSSATGTLSASHLRRKKELENSTNNSNRAIVYAGVTKVSIPRAGGQRMAHTSTSSSASTSAALPASVSSSTASMTNIGLPLNDQRRIAGKSIDMPSNTTRLIKSMDATTLRASRDKSVIDMSRTAVINGKLVAMRPASSLASTTAMNTSHNASRHYMHPASNKPKLTHYQQYKNSVANAMLQNTNSIHTFYPAEGNISLIPSQYGLKYKSTHLNALPEQQAPINGGVWSQSLARQPRR